MGSGLNSFKPMKEAVEEFTKEVGVAVTGHPKHDLAELLKQIFALEPVRQIGASAPFTPEGFATQVFCGSSGAEEAAARGLLRALIHARVPAAIPGETFGASAAAHPLFLPQRRQTLGVCHRGLHGAPSRSKKQWRTFLKGKHPDPRVIYRIPAVVSQARRRRGQPAPRDGIAKTENANGPSRRLTRINISE